MSTQQDIYAAGSENRPHMLNKENHVPWSSRLLHDAKSRPNGKLIYNSIINGPYVRRMIPEPVDSCELRKKSGYVYKQCESSDIREFKRRKLSCLIFEWETFYFPLIGNRLKWSRHVTLVHQTKDLHTADYTQLYDFLKYNQKEVDELRDERLAKSQDPLTLMDNSNNSLKYQVFRPDLPSSNSLLIAQKEEAGIQLQAEEFNLMAVAADLDEIEEVNTNCILMANLQRILHDNCYNDEIFNMFTQEEMYTELLEPIPEPHQVPQNDSNVISEVSSVEQGRGTVEQHPTNVEETRVLYDSLYNNLATEVEKVNSVNRKLRETNANLTTELARYKNQERCFEINQEKYDKLERCYQQSVYQEQCLSKKHDPPTIYDSRETLELA
ncbi:hypothetical protein Tco_1376704 [Tanacetum coccineum]